jgi:translation initiation factor 1
MGLFDGTPLERPILCDRCGLDTKVCQCPPPDIPFEKQRLKVRVEKRNKGKLVTCVRGFTGSETQREAILTKLKNQCGAGGTLDNDGIEIQGDQSKRVEKLLGEWGFRL